MAVIEAMPERHLEEYALFYQEQPFGLWREDYRAATIASTVANTVSKRPIGTSVFMPFHSHELTDEDEDMDALLMGAIKV